MFDPTGGGCSLLVLAVQAPQFTALESDLALGNRFTAVTILGQIHFRVGQPETNSPETALPQGEQSSKPRLDLYSDRHYPTLIACHWFSEQHRAAATNIIADSLNSHLAEVIRLGAFGSSRKYGIHHSIPKETSTYPIWNPSLGIFWCVASRDTAHLVIHHARDHLSTGPKARKVHDRTILLQVRDRV